MLIMGVNVDCALQNQDQESYLSGWPTTPDADSTMNQSELQANTSNLQIHSSKSRLTLVLVFLLTGCKRSEFC